MSDVVALALAGWNEPASPLDRERAILALESGKVVFLPRLAFRIRPDEAFLLSPSVGGHSKNVSLLGSGVVRGANLRESELEALRGLMTRFADLTGALVGRLLPEYATALQRARTSYRPASVSGRRTSWRKDDTRLHVDSFPASPMQGRRILRVFANVDPQGRPRRWRLGDSFEDVARRFVSSIPPPVPGASLVLKAFGVTKSRRSVYDHYMLRLHDRMKSDCDYQSSAARQLYDFPAGSAWMVFTDQVSHAAMSGQFALEQTFHLPVSTMRDPASSPLRILQGLLGRRLA